MTASRHVLIIGIGRSGLASAQTLRERGIAVLATDEKPVDRLAIPIAALEAFGAAFAPPENLAPFLAQIDEAILSPGVPRTSALVQAVQAAGIPIIGEIELAYRYAVAPIIAITGTKGKSTTTSLIGHFLRACGCDVRVGGNIGAPLVREVQGLNENGWVVAEVSSFQLESIVTFHPRVAVLLNVAEDHLDRYPSMDAYANAKMRIAEAQTSGDTFIANRDDERVRALVAAANLPSRIWWYTLHGEPPDAAMFVRNGGIRFSPAGCAPSFILACDEIPLVGEHNRRNVMAALLAALASGCEPETLRASMSAFTPPAHRMQTIASVDGVRYIDDSKATNPAAAIAALRSYDAPIILIAGGRAKGTEFAELGVTIRQRARLAVLIGESADALAAVCVPLPTLRAGSMEQAVRVARDAAYPGDVVLLSPACASFDMFGSAEERGEDFSAAVHSLVVERSHA